jgi:hypothetical protein
LYTKLLGEKDHKMQLNQTVSETIAANLMFFDNEKEKQKRLDMADKLVKRVLESSIVFSGKLFDSLIFVFTES